MTNVGTWGDLIDAVENDHFVGREQELRRFKRELWRARKSKKLIFFISGQGGVGKTTLLNRYQEMAEELSVVVAESDDQQRDIPTILGRFAEQLAQYGYPLKRFTERYNTYRQRREEIESDPNAPEGLAGLVGRSLVHVGFALSDGVPIVRKGLDLLDEEAIATQASQWASYLAKKLANKDEVALLKDPIPILSALFFTDLNKFAQKQQILLTFDNFEFTRHYLDDWIVNLNQYKPSLNIRLAIAGRTLPGVAWHHRRRVMLHVPLDIFTPEEAEEFLDSVEIDDTPRRQEILQFSGRLPVLMSWLADPDGDEPDPTVPTADIVDRFLRWVSDPQLRQAALYTAIARHFNLDILPAQTTNPIPSPSNRNSTGYSNDLSCANVNKAGNITLSCAAI